MHPLIGIWSDRTGKRKPFIVGGGVAVIISLFVIAWTREIVELFGGNGKGGMVAAVAVVFIYILDFGINSVQAAARAFITDNVSLAQQDTGNAWAGRMTGIGNVIGYTFGYADLPKRFPFLGDSQLKVLCWLASIGLASSIAIAGSVIRERPKLKTQDSLGSVFHVCKQLVTTTFELPREILNICFCQFVNWLGWFPFLFYMTTYVGEIFVESVYGDVARIPTHEEDKVLWEEATRIGSLALLLYACVSLISSILLPLIVIPAFSHDETLKDRYPFSWLSLRRLWSISQIIYAVAMFSTFFVYSPSHAIILTAMCGLSSTVSLWAPFALVSGEISKDGVESDLRKKAGIILGIHNSFISAPQLLMTIVSSLIFKLLAPDPNDDGARDTSIAWMLRLGGVCALCASYMATKVRDEIDEGEDRRTV